MATTSGRRLFLAAADGEQTSRPPAWMMRQAGRHLPEYRELREEYSFREAISTPDVAEEISLQPWHRYRPDGVVMFSDILTALEPLGIPYHIESGVGPVIDRPISDRSSLPAQVSPLDESVSYVGELLDRLREYLGDRAAVIGFVGGPFTLLAYALEGRPSRSFPAIRRLRYAQPEEFVALLERFGDVLARYVAYQVDHGADVVQLFDTYAGLLSREDYREYLLPVHRRILEAVTVPTIVFVRGMGGRLDLLAESGADVIGLDWTVEMAAARRTLGDTPVQGNLDPMALYADPETIRERTRQVIADAGHSGHIMNLGHGVHRETSPDHVEAFFEAVRGIERE